MQRRANAFLCSVLLASLVLTACGAQATPTATEPPPTQTPEETEAPPTEPPVRRCADGLQGETIIFYSQAGLTGPPSTLLDTTFVNGMNDGAANINATGGICGATVEIYLVDTQDDAAQEIGAYQMIRDADPPLVSISTYSTAASSALAPLVSEDHITNFAAGLNASAFYMPRNGYTVGVAPTYSDQFAGFLEFLSENWADIKPEGSGNEIVVGVIGWDNAFGEGATTPEALTFAESLGVTVLVLEKHPLVEDVEFVTLLVGLVLQGANVIYYQGLGEWAAQLNGTIRTLERTGAMDVVVGGVNWSMDVDVVNILGENAAAMNGYYGVFPYLWWNDTEVAGVQQAISAFEVGGYPDSEKSVGYIISYAGIHAWATIVEAAIDAVGFENLDSDTFFEAFREMGTVSALGLFTYDVRGETRAPRVAQIRQAQFIDGAIEFVVVKDFFELPDMRPPAE